MISPDETFDDRVLLKGNRLDMIGNPKGSTLQIKYSLNSNDVFQWKCAWESKLFGLSEGSWFKKSLSCDLRKKTGEALPHCKKLKSR